MEWRRFVTYLWSDPHIIIIIIIIIITAIIDINTKYAVSEQVTGVPDCCRVTGRYDRAAPVNTLSVG